MSARKQHVLIVGGKRYMQKWVQGLPGVETSLLWKSKKLKAADTLANCRVIGLNSDEATEWVHWAKALDAVHPVDHLAAFDDMYQDKAALIAKTLGLRCYSPETVESVQDKLVMRETLRRSGLDDTPAQAVGSVEDVCGFASRYGYPVILKPRNKEGSIGIARIRSDAEIARALDRALVESENAPLMVERMLEGEELSVEAISEGGSHQVVAITRKFKDTNTFVEVGHQLPAVLPAETAIALEQYVCSALDALRIQDGPSHTEVYLDKGRPRIVETHTRLGGDYIPEMVESVFGINLCQLSALQAIGISVMTRVREAMVGAAGEPRYAAVWFRNDSVPGTLREVLHIEDARKLEGVLQVTMLKDPGEELRPVNHSGDRLGLARAVGATPEEAMSRARQAANLLEVVVSLAGTVSTQ
jgi:biotin carboxylase